MKRPRLRTRLFIFGYLCIAVIFSAMIFANARKFIERRQQARDIARIENDIARIRNENVQNRVLLEQIQSPFFIEQEGREKLSAHKPGETVVLFPASEDANVVNIAENKKERQAPFFHAWSNYFFSMPK